MPRSALSDAGAAVPAVVVAAPLPFPLVFRSPHFSAAARILLLLLLVAQHPHVPRGTDAVHPTSVLPDIRIRGLGVRIAARDGPERAHPAAPALQGALGRRPRFVFAHSALAAGRTVASGIVGEAASDLRVRALPPIGAEQRIAASRLGGVLALPPRRRARPESRRLTIAPESFARVHRVPQRAPTAVPARQGLVGARVGRELARLSVISLGTLAERFVDRPSGLWVDRLGFDAGSSVAAKDGTGRDGGGFVTGSAFLQLGDGRDEQEDRRGQYQRRRKEERRGHGRNRGGGESEGREHW
mmetsp:Transcript_34497/g.63757  ORF Transcript_34497/g.63757 Transcript_34497/m.63757 type:complete len:300 (-) Transcript_34497:155-1054(-)